MHLCSFEKPNFGKFAGLGERRTNMGVFSPKNGENTPMSVRRSKRGAAGHAPRMTPRKFSVVFLIGSLNSLEFEPRILNILDCAKCRFLH